MSVEIHDPLCFEPMFKDYLWGGSRLRQLPGKTPPPSGPVAESWELCDLAEAQSLVRGGPLAGTPLHQLVQQARAQLLGPVGLDGGRFPLLVKYIDAHHTLSVQVHPDAETAARLGGRPKSEAWLILDADPDAVLYLGLQPGVGREQLADAIIAGTVEQVLRKVAVKPGELYPVRPGTVHAIGAGVLLAEVQQPSNTTYRVFDWNRVGPDGAPRQLHLDQALESIHVDAPPVEPAPRGQVGMGLFQIRTLELDPGEGQSLTGVGPAVLVGLAGQGQVAGESALPCGLGQVVLVPHALRSEVVLEAGDDGMRVLRVTFPSAR